MAESLYTESQIAAAMAVRHFTDMEPRYYEYINCTKRAYGGAFKQGNFWTGHVVVGRPEHRGRIDYHVVERDARLIFGHAHATRAEALCEARELIEKMGPDLLAKLIAERTAQRVASFQMVAERPARRRHQPRKITKRARAVFEASEGKCHYCGTVLTLDGRWHIEHKFPRALFGGSEQENLVAACAPCNHAKRDKTDLEFKALLASKAA